MPVDAGLRMFPMDDTIAAISTAAGSAARGIVRLSGPRALPIAAGLFVSQGVRLSELGGFRCADGLVRAGPADIELPARAYVFRRPKSYTRQDVIELHVPGPPAVVTAVESAAIDAGARRAEPGEFTARAFFSGRIDLSAAQAVADIIDAADDAQLRSAVSALGGRIHRICSDACERLAEALADVEASIDLAEEDIEPAPASEVARELKHLAANLRATADEAASVAETADCPHAVLVGRPNVGKSSLLNALTQTDRAIVSALAGTTRDVLSAPLHLPDGQAVLLEDAAGFAESRGHLAAAADSAARGALARADAVLLVVDPASGELDADLALLEDARRANPRAPVMVLANKSDLPTPEEFAKFVESLRAATGLPVFATSAVKQTGLRRVVRELSERLGLAADRGGGAMGLHDRQKRLLRAASDATDRAGDLLATAEHLADRAELVAVELRAALTELGQISGQTLDEGLPGVSRQGQVVTVDILGRIFRRFCVGK